MDVKFRNLRPSTLTRQVTPGRLPSESDQSFLEIVESVTGTESTPEENPNSGHDRQPALPARTARGDSPPNEEPPETTNESEKEGPRPTEESSVQDKPLGAQIDLTA